MWKMFEIRNMQAPYLSLQAHALCSMFVLCCIGIIKMVCSCGLSGSSGLLEPFVTIVFILKYGVKIPGIHTVGLSNEFCIMWKSGGYSLAFYNTAFMGAGLTDMRNISESVVILCYDIFFHLINRTILLALSQMCLCSKCLF